MKKYFYSSNSYLAGKRCKQLYFFCNFILYAYDSLTTILISVLISKFFPCGRRCEMFIYVHVHREHFWEKSLYMLCIPQALDSKVIKKGLSHINEIDCTNLPLLFTVSALFGNYKFLVLLNHQAPYHQHANHCSSIGRK